MSFAADVLLHSTDLSASIALVLQKLLEATQVSRIYVFEIHSDEKSRFLASQRFEAAGPGIESQLSNPELQNASFEGFERWQKRLWAGESIYGDIAEFPASERSLLEPQGIVSLVVVPIFAGDRLWGFVGFDECRVTRQWTPPEISALRAAAGNLGAAIQQDQTQDDLRRQINRLRALREVHLGIRSRPQFQQTLRSLLAHLVGCLRADAATLLLLNPKRRVLEFAASHGFRTPALRKTRLAPGQGLAGQAVEEKRVVSRLDLVQDAGAFSRSHFFPREEFVTYFAVPLITKETVVGVAEIFQRRRFEPDSEWLLFLDTLARQVAITIYNASLFRDLNQSNAELERAYDATLEGWSRAMDLRDHETEGHTRRVTEMTLKLARRLGIDDQELIHIRRGALLHDIGKIGIPDSILLKPGKLTDEEFRAMQTHPVLAFEMLSPVSYLRKALDIPYCHHEKWDGSGYPRQLRGRNIPRAARIFALSDVFDALTSDRPYRKKWTVEAALSYIREQAGSHFDPDLARHFVRMVEESDDFRVE